MAYFFAISVGELSRNVYSKDKLDVKLVKEGLLGYFGDSKLVVLSFALSPPRLLEFLTNYPGRALVSARLERRWPAADFAEPTPRKFLMR